LTIRLARGELHALRRRVQNMRFDMNRSHTLVRAISAPHPTLRRTGRDDFASPWRNHHGFVVDEEH
jgi:hypothetical protein